MSLSSPNLISSGGNQGVILRSLREYLALLEGGGSGGARATTALGGWPLIAGLVPSNAADATNDVTFTVGVARGYNASNETALLALTASITKQLDVAWAKGTNAGGLDTGAVGNNTYHWWLIGNPATREVDVLASLSSTAPTMPSGYTLKRRIFSFVRLAGANQVFTAYEKSGGGLYTELKVPVRDFVTNNPSANAVTWTTSAPLGIKFNVKVNFLVTNTTTQRRWLVTSADQADTAPSANLKHGDLPPVIVDYASNSAEYELICSTSATIRYRFDSSDVNITAEGITNGWTDNRVS